MVGGMNVFSLDLGHMTLQKPSSSEPAGRFSRDLVCSIGDSSPP